MNSTRFRHGLVYLLVVIAIISIVWGVRNRSPRPDELPISEVAVAANEGKVEKIEVNNDELIVTFDDDKEATSTKEPGTTAPEQLAALGVSAESLSDIEWQVKEPRDITTWLAALTYILPLIFVAGVIFLLLRQAQGTNNQALSFGKSRARMFSGDQPTVTFDDVAGVEEAKEELEEVVEFLKEPDKFIQLGARIPKGVLLVGAPGTGKTLLAKAVSGEAGVPFFSISGSEFVEMFVGVGASRVRDLFEQAKRHSPCIVFVDEIDAVGRHRGAGLGGSHDEREQTLNQILVEMDGFDTDTNVIIVAATNRPDILDPALLRPGRFDRRVVLDRPDMKGREGILKVHVRGKPLANDIDLAVLARSTPGFVGADIENMVNEAALLAARRGKKSIEMDDFQEAIERVMAGPERRSRIMSQEELLIVAYHEAGHALLASLLPHSDPVHKVTIMPRGRAAGYVMHFPEVETRLTAKAKLEAQMIGTLGGRAAEELVFDDITDGASSDMEMVTKAARAMVTRLGMSEELGPMIWGQKDELVFLGREIGEQRDYSDAVAEKIDAEVRRMVEESYQTALTMLSENRDLLDKIAMRLLEVETLSREEFEKLLTPVPRIPFPQPLEPIEIPKRAEGSPPPRGGSKSKPPADGDDTEDAPGGLDLPPATAPA
jgi:cell division protease FtsH